MVRPPDALTQAMHHCHNARMDRFARLLCAQRSSLTETNTPVSRLINRGVAARCNDFHVKA